MGSRLKLQTLLETIVNNVYFQPPPSFKITYPCIVYSRVNIRPKFADNTSYKLTNQYELTIIDIDPDSMFPTEIAKLPQCTFDRHYVVDNLNHDVFNILF
jgi:hypothetical protein